MAAVAAAAAAAVAVGAAMGAAALAAAAPAASAAPAAPAAPAGAAAPTAWGWGLADSTSDGSAAVRAATTAYATQVPATGDRLGGGEETRPTGLPARPCGRRRLDHGERVPRWRRRLYNCIVKRLALSYKSMISTARSILLEVLIMRCVHEQTSHRVKTPSNTRKKSGDAQERHEQADWLREQVDSHTPSEAF